MTFRAINIVSCCIIAMSAFAASAETAQPDNQQILTCLQENIRVEATNFDKSIIEGRKIFVTIENEMSSPLGGVWVSFEIWSKERPMPLYEGSIRSAATIAGGLLPGEAISEYDVHFMDDRAIQIAQSSSDLSIKLTVENAADTNMDGFLDHPRMGSWSNADTKLKCEPIKQ